MTPLYRESKKKQGEISEKINRTDAKRSDRGPIVHILVLKILSTCVHFIDVFAWFATGTVGTYSLV